MYQRRGYDSAKQIGHLLKYLLIGLVVGAALAVIGRGLGAPDRLAGALLIIPIILALIVGGVNYE